MSEVPITAVTRAEAGAKIKSARDAHGWTQAQLAATAKVPSWAVAQAEIGKAVGQDKLDAMTLALELDRLLILPKSRATKKHPVPSAVQPPKKARARKPLRRVTKLEIIEAVNQLAEVIKNVDRKERRLVLDLVTKYHL